MRGLALVLLQSQNEVESHIRINGILNHIACRKGCGLMRIPMVKVLTLALGCSFIVISACSTNHEIRPRTVNEIDQLDVADPDNNLALGDLGVESLIYRHRLRSLATEDPNKKTLVDPNGYPLILHLPDPSIKPINGSYVENVIETAKRYKGTPYEYGSDRTNPSSFDCSDFTRWVFLYSLGIDLPWDSRSQAAYVKAFSKRTFTSLKGARRGDLLFFTSYRGEMASNYQGLKPSEKPITHVGIYMGSGYIIQCASKNSGGVHIRLLTWRQLTNRFLFGGNILT